MKIFTIDAKHWWDYLNPFWWRRKRVIEAVLNYAWDKHGMQKKMDQAIKDAVLYGKGSVHVDWDEPDTQAGGKEWKGNLK